MAFICLCMCVDMYSVTVRNRIYMCGFALDVLIELGVVASHRLHFKCVLPCHVVKLIRAGILLLV